MITSYVSIDLETTGLNPKLDKIIEIGGVKVIEGVQVATFSTLIHPGRKLEERICELTGISDEMLTDAPDMADVLPSLLFFLEELPLLGHKILFDYSFLKKAAVDRKLSFEKEGIDTLKIARRYCLGAEKKSLEYLCEYYGIRHQAHRALGDAHATSALYQKLAQEFGKQDAQEKQQVFVPHQLQYQAKRDTPITKVQKERLYRLLQQHNIVLDQCVDKMTRSEADRTIDRILGFRYNNLSGSNDKE